MPMRQYCVAFLFLLFNSNDVGARSTLPPDPSPLVMVGVSPVIFSGIVTDTHYGFHPGSKMPYTFIKFAAVEYLRKDSGVDTQSGNTVEISVAGGIRENHRILHVDEMPQFVLGERYLVFLRGGPWRFSPITGLHSGVFRLHGRLTDDAMLLNYAGQPLERIGDAAFIPAKERREIGETNASESGLEDFQLRRLSSLSGNAKDAGVEKAAAESHLVGRVMAGPDAVKEEDDPKGRFANYGRLMRVSDLKQFIDKAVSQTAGQYPEFSSLSLRPVAGSGGFNAIGPKEDLVGSPPLDQNQGPFNKSGRLAP